MAQIKHIKSVTIPDVSASTAIVRPSDWNSDHAFTLLEGLSVDGNPSLITSGTVYLYGTNNINLSQSGNSITISDAIQYESSYDNLPGVPLATRNYAPGSTSNAVAFHLEENISCGFIRMPIGIALTSVSRTTITGSANASFSFGSTYNVGFYTQGNNASSGSLYSVATAQALFSYVHSVSLTSRSITHSMFYSYNAEGVTSTFSTSSSINTATNYAFSTNLISDFSGARFLDIPFDNSLEAGAYWMLYGISTTSSTNGTILGGVTNAAPRYTNNYAASVLNSNIGAMGASNLTSGAYLGAGSYSNAAGSTVADFALSQLSTNASHQRLYFQLLRSA